MLTGKHVVRLSGDAALGAVYSARLRHAGAAVVDVDADLIHADAELETRLELVAEAGPIDGVMVVVGAPPDGPVAHIKSDDWRRLMLRGPALISSSLRALGPSLASRHGAIVVTTCTFALEGWPGQGLRAALHGATFALIKSAVEETPRDVFRLNAVSLPMFDDLSDHRDAADIAAYLLSDLAVGMHGDVIAAVPAS